MCDGREGRRKGSKSERNKLIDRLPWKRLEGIEVASPVQRLPGVPALRGVPGAFRGVFGTPVNFLSTFDDSLARWASLAARRAESPT